MADTLLNILSKIGEYSVDPTIRQVRYLFHFKSIVEDLKKESEKLQSKQARVQHDVSIAEQNDEATEEDVLKWLSEVEGDMKEVQNLEEKILGNKRCLCGWCPNMIWRYNLGKDAMKKTTTIRKLQEDGNFDRVSYPKGLEFIPSRQTHFKSTESAFNQIMEALKSDECNMIGLYGTGGVGKTTLAEEVRKKAKELKLFDILVMVVVSQNPKFTQIQDEIAEWLGLKIEETGKEARASRLFSRLMNEKKILIILDDVWENLNLAKDIGLPYGDDHKGCKILLTTRRLHVCNVMGSQKNIQLNALSEEDAWALFQKSAALNDNSPTLNDVAMEVAKECKGLPLAIVAVGSALNGKNLDEYKLASENLKRSKPVGIEDIDEKVYASLQLSYDYLKTKGTKLCFLLCSLFPEDYDINIEDLFRYGMGLDLFQDNDSIEKARTQFRVTINDLKASSLLLEVSSLFLELSGMLESSRQEFVKMHDVVRDVALWIASKGENVFMVRAGVGLTAWPKKERFEHCSAISLMENKLKELPSKVECPKLEILLLGGDSVKISDAFFEEMKALKVLRINKGILSPQSLQFLTNLRTLVLGYCEFDDISSLGKLKKLEILCFYGYTIEELPNEIGELNNLRLLDLKWCNQLKRIPSNVISKLSKLEELYIGGYNSINWEVKGPDVERSDASLWELNKLSDLDVLSLRFDAKYLPIGFAFPKLGRYTINMCDSRSKYPTSSRSLRIKDINATSLNAFKELFPTVEYLHLVSAAGFQNIIPNMDQGDLNDLISLDLQSCDEMKCMIDSTQQHVSTAAFSNLVNLSLYEMAHLREIWYGERPPMGFLQKLKTLMVRNCSNMPSIFPQKLLQILQNLEEVTVNSCDEVQEVFGLEGPTHHVVERTHVMLLSNLTSLYLIALPKLSCIWKGPTQHISLQRLINVTVSKCNRLTYVFSSSLARSLVQLQGLKIDNCDGLEQIIIIEKEDGEILTEAHVQPLCFSKLTTLQIINCEKLEYIFPISIARSLRQLEKLQILNCPQLKQVFSHGKEDDVFVGDGNDIELPKLRLIELKGLSSLTSFSEGNYHWMWPSIKELTVVECPKLTSSFNTDLEASLKQLRILWIGNYSLLHTTILLLLRQGLQKLEELTIENCEGVEEVFHSISTNTDDELSASNLKQLRVLRIRNHIQLHKPIILLQNLEKLIIENCEGVEEVFHDISSVSKLKELELRDLPELRVIWKGLIQKSSFQNLTKIDVSKCNKLTHLFSPRLASNLPRLEILWIVECEELERIIDEEDKDKEDQIIGFPNLKNIHVREEKKIMLHQLKSLILFKLPRLISLCGYHFIFPSLNELEVRDCPKITTRFTIASDDKTVHAKDKAKTEKSYVVDESDNDEDVEGAKVKVEEEEEKVEEDEIIESDIELEGKIVEPDNAPPHKTPQLVDEDLLEGSSTTHATVATRPSGSNIVWYRWEQSHYPHTWKNR